MPDMPNWKNMFKPWILARGQEYFDCGQVVKLEEDGSAVRAEVSGSRAYHVEIHRSGERVHCMSCDCPHAAGGENCKHMAAVLMTLDEKTAPPRLDWQSALAQMLEEQVRELLRSLVEEDGTLQDRIVRMISGPGDDPARWQDDLEQIISDYTDYHGGLDYDRAYDCMVEVAEYLEECLPSLLIGGQLVDAAKLTMTVYGAAWGLDMDDSDGGLTIVSEHCREAMAKILSLADAQQERNIFYLLHKFKENSDWNYGSDNLEELILSLDWSRELQQKNLQYLDENLDSWRMCQRAELMERMGASKVEVIAWWEQHRNDDGAYHPLLRLYEEENLLKAIELVREKREWEKNTIWQITDYTKTLLRLLEKSEDWAEYEKELRYLVVKLKCQETEFVSQLKRITPVEQWPAVFEILLADAKRPVDRMQLYHLEEKYNELSVELSRYPYIGTFQSYEETLHHWNSEWTLKLYTEILKIEMDRACDRKQYRYIVSHLCRLKVYPNGQEGAKALAAYWYVNHKNRPAMKDELKKAGYPQI